MTENVLTRLEDTARMCMSEKRYAHTLGVYCECEYLADKCALSQKERDDLLTASLLHDIAKQLPVDKQKNICMRHGTDISGATEATLHQLSGAEYARELLGSDIVNDVVYSAVSKHTTGGSVMSLTDKLLFIADYTEAGRTHEMCRKMREYLHENCEKIVEAEEVRRFITRFALMLTDNTEQHLTSTGAEKDPRMGYARATLEAEIKTAKES